MFTIVKYFIENASLLLNVAEILKCSCTENDNAQPFQLIWNYVSFQKLVFANNTAMP